jgi:hypothetical protein
VAGWSHASVSRRATGTENAEIKIGNIKPYSGPASSYGVIGKTEEAHFRKIKREMLLRKARQAETAVHRDEWLSSPGPTRRCACASSQLCTTLDPAI